MEWVVSNPDAHLSCFGLRWCGRCGEAARFKRNCAPCHAIDSRNYWRRQRRLQGFSSAYERNKAAKRLKYRLNPAYAEKMKANWRRRHAQRQEVAA